MKYKKKKKKETVIANVFTFLKGPFILYKGICMLVFNEKHAEEKKKSFSFFFFFTLKAPGFCFSLTCLKFIFNTQLQPFLYPSNRSSIHNTQSLNKTIGGNYIIINNKREFETIKLVKFKNKTKSGRNIGTRLHHYLVLMKCLYYKRLFMQKMNSLLIPDSEKGHLF